MLHLSVDSYNLCNHLNKFGGSVCCDVYNLYRTCFMVLFYDKMNRKLH